MNTVDSKAIITQNRDLENVVGQDIDDNNYNYKDQGINLSLVKQNTVHLEDDEVFTQRKNMADSTNLAIRKVLTTENDLSISNRSKVQDMNI